MKTRQFIERLSIDAVGRSLVPAAICQQLWAPLRLGLQILPTGKEGSTDPQAIMSLLLLGTLLLSGGGDSSHLCQPLRFVEVTTLEGSMKEY